MPLEAARSASQAGEAHVACREWDLARIAGMEQVRWKVGGCGGWRASYRDAGASWRLGAGISRRCGRVSAGRRILWYLLAGGNAVRACGSRGGAYSRTRGSSRIMVRKRAVIIVGCRG